MLTAPRLTTPVRSCLALCLAALSLTLPLAPSAAAQERRPNVLFIISDDLSAEALGCYGNAQCRTPSVDQLAARGTLFTRAYCQYPVCGPSRAALMSGLYPQTLGILSNTAVAKFAAGLGRRPSLGQLFKGAGYPSVRVGKVYHMRVPGDITRGSHGHDHSASWTERYSVTAPEWRTPGDYEQLSHEKLKRPKRKHYDLGFGSAFYVVRAEGDGAEQADVLAADKAIEVLTRVKDEPFFLAVGFVRPHVPLVAPARFHKAYPQEDMALAESVDGDWDDIPKLGITKNSAGSGLTTQEKKRKVLSAYYASVSFMDTQVGRILNTLEQLQLTENTIVVFTSDHGYHLGEHELWQKSSLHEESARIPLIISAPGKQAAVSGSLVEQIDIYPTLADLCGLEIPEHVQGESLVSVLDDLSHTVREFAYCTNGGSADQGHLIRTARYAFLAWPDGTGELYDMERDPKQFTNLIDEEAQAEVVARMRARIAAKLERIAK